VSISKSQIDVKHFLTKEFALLAQIISARSIHEKLSLTIPLLIELLVLFATFFNLTPPVLMLLVPPDRCGKSLFKLGFGLPSHNLFHFLRR
jgi:hypothetical protein